MSGVLRVMPLPTVTNGETSTRIFVRIVFCTVIDHVKYVLGQMRYLSPAAGHTNTSFFLVLAIGYWNKVGCTVD